MNPDQVRDAAPDVTAVRRRAAPTGDAKAVPPVATPDWGSPVRLALAGVLALTAAHALHLDEGLWSVMSAVIVMRAQPGRSLHAGRDRLIATVFGAGVALVVVLLRVWHIPDTLLIALCLAVTGALVAWRPTLGAAPIAAILVLSSGGAGEFPLRVALLRVAEISIGAAVGVAVTSLAAQRFVPAWLRPKVRKRRPAGAP